MAVIELIDKKGNKLVLKSLDEGWSIQVNGGAITYITNGNILSLSPEQELVRTANIELVTGTKGEHDDFGKLIKSFEIPESTILEDLSKQGYTIVSTDNEAYPTQINTHDIQTRDRTRTRIYS